MKIAPGILTALTLMAFGLRAYHLGSPPLLWDEGWSIGLSRLPLNEILRITALDVHPPLYYLLLKGWLVLGSHEFMTRFLSVVAGVLTVPLGYHAGRVWRDRHVGLLTALYLTIAPPLVYYSQITRMYALCVMFLVLGTYGLLESLDPRSAVRSRAWAWRPGLVFVVGAVGALYSFYYTDFVLVAMFMHALVVAPKRWKRMLVGFALVAVLYLPWVGYAVPAMLGRVNQRTGFNFELGSAVKLALGGFYGLVFPYGIGWPAVYAILAVVVVGLLRGAHRLGRWALLPALAVSLTLGGAALGAQAHMFAARYTIVASPFLALGLAGALALLVHEPGPRSLEGRKRTPISNLQSLISLIQQHGIFALGLTLILATTVPTITHYVYTKSYEIFDPFDPRTDWQVLHGLAGADDLVFFNVLSLAGTYDRYRAADDPPWSYALRWDPVIEPLDVAIARIEANASSHDRLWFVLYKGTVSANADLKSWLDQRFFPAAAPGWQGDTLYLAYVDPRAPWQTDALNIAFEGGIMLDQARFTPATSSNTAGIELRWHARGEAAPEAKVFVHLYDAAGQLVAQHDGFPVNDTRPPPSWQVDETIVDRHGLVLPADAGPWQLVVGLYDPNTRVRLSTADGQDHVEIATITRAAR